MKTCPEELLFFIPSEKLTELYLNDHMEFFLSNATRLQRLTRLTLENNCYSNSFPHLPRLPVPSVQTLSCAAFRSIDISGLRNLTDLAVEGINLVHGKEEIFPQLKSLSGISDAFNGMDFRNYPKLKKLSYTALSEESRQHLEFFENIPDTALEVRFRTENQKDGVFRVRERARSLQFLVNPASEVVVLNPKQHFSRIEISVPMFRNLSWFQNVSILLLYVCQSLTDILPIAHVPYLSLVNCQNVKDFSCLGEKQRFLQLIRATSLTEADLRRFGRISYLEIFDCPQIKRIDSLPNNRFLTVGHCGQLTECHFSGIHHVKVYIFRCYQLSKITVTGKINILSLKKCDSVNVKTIKNCGDIQVE
jgi:hypothetical protein